jgi:hypothetical protein
MAGIKPTPFLNFKGTNSYLNSSVLDSTNAAVRFKYSPSIGFKVNQSQSTFNVKRGNHAFGINILLNENGPYIREQRLYFRMAQSIKLDSKNSLHFGVNAGFYNFRYDGTSNYGGGSVFLPDANISFGLYRTNFFASMNINQAFNNTKLIDGVNLDLNRTFRSISKYEAELGDLIWYSTIELILDDSFQANYYGVIQKNRWSAGTGVNSDLTYYAILGLQKLPLGKGLLSINAIGSLPTGASLILPNAQIGIKYQIK